MSETDCADRLLRLAGEVVRLGGWRVNLADKSVVWTKGIAAIHAMPPGYSPDFDGGIDFFAPEDQDGARDVFRACATDGTPFSDVRQIIDANGKRVWVRSVGEAEYDEAGNIVAVQGAMQDISELIEAQEEAEALSRKLLITFESIRDAFITVDCNWRVVLVNSQAVHALRKVRSEIVGHSIWDVFPKAIGTVLWDRLHHAMVVNDAMRFVTYLTPLQSWFDVAVFPSSEGLSIYFQDVTAQRALEKQLNLLEVAVSRQADTLLITDASGADPASGKVVYVNDAFTRLTGYSREEIIGRSPRMLQGPKTQLDEIDRIRAALLAHEPVRAELINYHKNGTPYWLEMDITPIKDDSENLVHYVSIQRDVTARKAAEAEARMLNERFRLAAEATTDVIWDWDVVTNQLWWSGAMTDIHGHACGVATTADDWKALIHPDDRERVDEGTQIILNSTRNHWEDEYRIIRADGTIATVADRGSVLRDENGSPLRMIGSMYDMTERLGLEAQLQQSQRLEAVGQLTGGIAHDFNNLLTVILGSSELLSDRLSDRPDLKQLADITADAAERGADLTSRLLAFARKQPLKSAAVDVAALIRRMDALLLRTLPANIVLEYDLDGALWSAEADAAQLESALLNLALNSRDAMPDGGRLRIGAGNAVSDQSMAGELAPGNYVEILVSDNGIGMAQGIVKRAFDPFFTTKPPSKGSGLGLSMIYGFAKQSEGHVKIISDPGAGTTVRLMLPRSRTSAPETDLLKRPTGTTTKSERCVHILLVEDDQNVADHVFNLLASLGHRVTIAHNGEEALGILEKRPDIVLLFSDIVMPGELTGHTLADAARRMRPTLKVLFTSGYDEVATGKIAVQSRYEMLSKPYRRSDLIAKVRAVLAE